ncbi:ABC transporter ATP-binding protein [Prochlorococcus marinus]|uniref:ABC transporter ATP-binding protein n=1 Tax=Prochlorococcus marinus TaxID=1219 RepID=UPI0022B46F0A|nr:ABC transporter ATP-binding protein [Prochlorococcus marinus]
MEFDKVSFSLPNGVKVFDQCSFSILKPGLWMLVGENGSGKSTLFRLISGVIRPDSGKIFCSLRPSMVYQNPEHQLLMPTCKSELMLSAPKTTRHCNLLDLIQSSLEKVELGEMLDRPIHTLSGGQKQRLALAGAIVSNSNLLLLDEPTALLDPQCQNSILKLIKKLTSSSADPITAIWVTHRLEELYFCDGAAIVKNGGVGNWNSGPKVFQELKSLALR